METASLPKIDVTRCIRCGQCVAACPQAALQLDDQGVTIIAPDTCTYCGLCESLCPTHAVVLEYAIVWGEEAEF
ncbi:MAG: 4Fe-4S binding protein [Anaerolineae bacterium]|nr:4Fe-4S binding protein [Anaerolineae bacterium]